DLWDMQIGPNGKLYLLSDGGYNGVVECPNKRGTACNVDLNLPFIPATNFIPPLEFPTYPAHFFASNDSCGAVLVGVEAEVEENGLELVPNPAGEVVEVSFWGKGLGNGWNRLKLIGMDGRMVLEKMEEGHDFSVLLDLKDVPAGIYIVEVEGNGESFRKRLIVR
ncbi:MAG: T9SS type A sorting domain-containing protein, partial [Bacteroidota bacterium]